MPLSDYLQDKLSHIYALCKKGDYILTLDNTASGVWEDCRRKFLYLILLNLREGTESAPITFGKATHKFLELYHAGFPFAECFEGFCRVAIASNSRITITRQQSVDLNAVTEYSMEFGYLLCKTYAEKHPLDKETFTISKDSTGKPYLETGFAVELPNGIMVGLIDGVGVVTYNSRDAIIDHKTTKHNLNSTFFQDFNPNNQISTYLYAAREYLEKDFRTAIINGVRVKDFKRGDEAKNDDALFSRIETTREPEQLEQRMRHANYQFGEIQAAIDYGIDAFPMHTPIACHTKYGTCPYTRLCMAKSTHMLEILAETTYVKERWIPYEELRMSDTENIIDITVPDVNNIDNTKVDLIPKGEFVKKIEDV